MAFTQQQVTALLNALPNNKQQAINAAALATLLGYSPSPNQEELRELIRHAIGQGELIGSSRQGYWQITNINELDAVLNSLERRAQRICDRRNRLINNWTNRFPIPTQPHKNVQ